MRAATTEAGPADGARRPGDPATGMTMVPRDQTTEALRAMVRL